MSTGYFNKVKETIREYTRQNGYHLEESEVLEAIKCAVEDVYLLSGRKAILNISVMPPEVIDVTGEEAKVIPFKKMFGLILPRHFLERVKFFVERFEREKIFATYRPLKGQIIKAEVMGETFFLGSRGLEWLKVNKRFEGTIVEFGERHNIYVESGKENIVIHPRDYRMWDIATYIYDESGYMMSINPHKKTLRLKKQGKAVIFNIFGAIAIMPSDERVKTEQYEQGQEYEVILYDVNQAAKEGYQLYVSRKQINFVVEIISKYIEEFKNVKVKAIAREPGVCSKILISSNGKKIKWGEHRDSLEKIRGITGEKIEFIEHDNDMEQTIKSALDYDGGVKINSFDKTALIVTLNKGAVIGRGGVNVKLAGMLTGYKFTIVTPDEYIMQHL